MLDFLRQRKRNWIIIFFLGAIIVSFALFYGGNKLQDKTSGEVVEINGEVISQRDFAVQYQRTIERYREMFKGALTPEMIKGLNIKGNLVEEMIQKRLVLQEARSLGLAASDDDLANSLAKVPEFQVAGRFNKERYLQILQANRLLPAQFEEDQRDQLTTERLYSLILDTLQVTEAEVRERYRIAEEKINLSYLRLATADFVGQVKLSDDDMKKYYDRNKESFKEPLKLQIEYLAYPIDRFAAAAKNSEKEIADYYQANLNTKFRKPKEVKVRYISIRVPPNADDKQKAAARAKLDALAKEARSGKDFTALAKGSANDPSAPQSGEAGWVVQGQLPPVVDKVLFALAKGEISASVEAPAGYQIFKVDDTKQEKNPALKEATAEIDKILKTEKAKREAAKAAERDREKAISATDWGKLAQDSGVSAHVSSWFANGEIVPEIGQNQEFYKAAFALGPKEVSSLIEGTNTYYLLRVKQRKEPAIAPIENLRERIDQALKESKAYELVLQKGNALLETLKKENDIAKLAAANGLKIEETGWFARNAPQLPKIGELAEMRSGSLLLTAQKPSADKLYTQKDAAFILALKETQPADMEQFEKQKDVLRKQALAEGRQRALIKFLETLKAKAKIKVNNAFLEDS